MCHRVFNVSFDLETHINPYQPTYTFPVEFDNNLELMEKFMRKAASLNLDEKDDRHLSQEHRNSAKKAIHFEDGHTSANETLKHVSGKLHLLFFFI